MLPKRYPTRMVMMTLVVVILFLLFWDEEGCVSSRLLCKDYTMEWRLLHEKNEICFLKGFVVWMKGG